MDQSSWRTDPVTPSAVYLVPTTADGRIIAIAERRRGNLPFWSLPTAQRRHPHSDPVPIARRIANSLDLAYTDLRPLLVPDAQDFLPAVFTIEVTWTDGRPVFLHCGSHQLHALRVDSDLLDSIDLRPSSVRAILRDHIGIADGLETRELTGASR